MLSGPPQVATWGVFFGEYQQLPNRVAFVVDGFNLYHSLKSASDGPKPLPARWLDLKALCEAHLHVIGNGATLSSIYYFSAIAKHLEAFDYGGRNPADLRFQRQQSGKSLKGLSLFEGPAR